MGEYSQWEIIISIDLEPRTLLLKYFIEHQVYDGEAESEGCTAINFPVLCLMQLSQLRRLHFLVKLITHAQHYHCICLAGRTLRAERTV